MSHPTPADRLWCRKDVTGDRPRASGTSSSGNLTQWHNNGWDCSPRSGQWATIVSRCGYACDQACRGDGTTDRINLYGGEDLVTRQVAYARSDADAKPGAQ